MIDSDSNEEISRLESLSSSSDIEREELNTCTPVTTCPALCTQTNSKACTAVSLTAHRSDIAQSPAFPPVQPK